MKLFTNILHFTAIFFTELDKIFSTRYLALLILLVVVGLGAAALGAFVISLILAGWEAYAEMVKDAD